MTPCPKCDDIRIVCLSELPFEKAWHATCKCGNAWNWSSPCRTRREAKENWERLMKEWNRNQNKERKR